MEKGKRKLLLPGFEPRTLCMAGQNANLYYINNNEILSTTISEQIFEHKFLKLLILMKKI